MNQYGLKLTGVYTNNNTILYEIENSIGDKRYFIHRGWQSLTVSSVENMELITNDTVIKELIRYHNERACDILESTGFTYTCTWVDDLVLVLKDNEEEDKTIWDWIRTQSPDLSKKK